MTKCTNIKEAVEALRNKRIEAGVSQATLGNASGLTQQYINAVEAGTRVPTYDTLAKIAKALKCEISIRISN